MERLLTPSPGRRRPDTVLAVKSSISRLLWRLALLALAFLLAPFLWIGVGLIMMGVGGEAWTLKVAQHVPAALELYSALMGAAPDEGTRELMRVALSLAGVLSLSLGYFPVYDVWRRGCVPRPEQEVEVEEEEVYIIP